MSLAELAALPLSTKKSEYDEIEAELELRGSSEFLPFDLPFDDAEPLEGDDEPLPATSTLRIKVAEDSRHSVQVVPDGVAGDQDIHTLYPGCLLYTSPSPRDRTRSRMPSSA